MDKKTKKRLAVLWERRQKLKKMLAGAKQQCDEPGEIEALERQIAQTQEEISALAGLGKGRNDSPRTNHDR